MPTSEIQLARKSKFVSACGRKSGEQTITKCFYSVCRGGGGRKCGYGYNVLCVCVCVVRTWEGEIDEGHVTRHHQSPILLLLNSYLHQRVHCFCWLRSGWVYRCLWPTFLCSLSLLCLPLLCIRPSTPWTGNNNWLTLYRPFTKWVDNMSIMTSEIYRLWPTFFPLLLFLTITLHVSSSNRKK